LFKNLPF